MSKLPFERKNKEVLTKQEAKSSDKYGVNPYNRSLERFLEYGVVNVDKPSGPTSHQVTSYVKKTLDVDKAGHSGTLDPKVTGVLPIGLGKGTRITNSLLKAGKEYVCLLNLHEEVGQEEVLDVLKSFEGIIEQVPPVKSAVKRKKRERTVYYIDVLEVKGREVLFKVGCEAGTYIRKLCHDVGEELGVGGHMADLRRTKVGPFGEDSLTTLHNLKDAFYLWKDEGDEKALRRALLPLETGVEHLPKVWVLDTTVNNLSNGASLKVPGVARVTSDLDREDSVAVLTLKGELVMIGTARMGAEEILDNEKGLAVSPEQVFMKPGTYPKFEN